MKIQRGKRQLLHQPNNIVDKRLRTQHIIIIAISAVLALLFFNIGKSVYESVQLQIANQELEAKIDDLYLEKQDLITKKQQIEEDAVLEHEAKKSLGLIKPGEKVLVIKEQ